MNKVGMITHYVDLNVYTRIHKEMRFLVAEIGREDILLGYPWLSTFHLEFYWREGHICNSYLPIELSSIHPWLHWNPVIAALCIEEKLQIISQLKDDCQICTTSTNLAITAKSQEKVVELPKEYQQFASVFSEEELQLFPPKQSWDHTVDFKVGVPDSIGCNIYPMTQKEDKVLDDFIDEQLAKGYICPSISLYTSSFFFIKKKDGKLQPVQDYRNINKWTVCNQYPLPLITSLIWDLGGAHIFSKLDVHWGYNNVWIKEGDEHKAAFKTQRGLYKLTVMFFGLTNSLATFQAMMNSLYCDPITKHEAFGMFIWIYMDNITIAMHTPSLEAHIAAVTDVLT